MKFSIWDFLTIVFMLGILFVAGVVGMIFVDPNGAINPLKPPTDVPAVVIPTSTPTLNKLPPTWSPTPGTAQTLVPSATLKPTRPASTPLPTRTPFILPSPTLPKANAFPTNDHLPLDGKCKVVSQTPEDGTAMKVGSEFTTAWTLENTGDIAWDKNNVDVRYKTGDKMQKAGDAVDLPQSVGVGESTKITITMIVPSTPGYHIVYWNLVSGSQPLCTFYVEILGE